MRSTYIRQNIILLTLYHICSNGFAFAIPVLVLFWKGYGLSLTAIMLLQSYFAFLIVLLEVPSGYLADVWGRKPVLRLAGIFLAAASGVYLVADTYVYFMLAETFFALGISLFSGTDAALLYDTLLEHEKTERFDKIWGSICTVSLIASGGYTALSGVLYSQHVRLPFLISLIVTACMFLAAAGMTEPQRSRACEHGQYVAEFFRILKKAILENREYRLTLMNFTFIQTVTHVGFWFYQPYFVSIGVDPFWFGFIFTFYSCCAAVASKLSHRLHERVGRTWRVVLQSAVLASGFMLMGICTLRWGFLIGLIPQMIYGWLLVSRSSEVNKLVQSSERATLLSFCSMSGNLIYAFVLPGFGLVADTFSLQHAITLCGVVSGGGALFVLISKFVLFPRFTQNGVQQCPP